MKYDRNLQKSKVLARFNISFALLLALTQLTPCFAADASSSAQIRPVDKVAYPSAPRPSNESAHGTVCALGETSGYVAKLLISAGVEFSSYSKCHMLIYTPSKKISASEKNTIKKSMKNGMEVVLDGYGDSEAESTRIKNLGLTLIGAGFMADAAVIGKSPYDKGYVTTPLFTRANAERLVAAKKMGEEVFDNTVEAYFKTPQKQ